MHAYSALDNHLTFDLLTSVSVRVKRILVLILNHVWSTVGRFGAGVVSNISQCQIALICAIARVRSRKVLCAAVYLIFISLVTLRLGS